LCAKWISRVRLYRLPESVERESRSPRGGVALSAIVVVHGIWNRQKGVSAQAAATALGELASGHLARGLANAGTALAASPEVVMAYYADLLVDGPEDEQGGVDGLDGLTEPELALVRDWLELAGVQVAEEPQNPVLWPVRQALGVLARRRGGSAQRCGRLVAALIREVSAYTGQQHRRRAVRDRVADTISRARPSVVVAHSLGSVVAYEALHAHPELDVDLLVTLGSPLAAPGAVFHALEPGPRDGRGAKPAGVTEWHNFADLGDLVALPPRLGDLFPVDSHANVHIGLLDFHSLGSYLAHPKVAAAITGHLAR
jgi:hypothetical protein